MPAEHHITVSKTARYYTQGQLDEHCNEVWILLHGYAQLASSFIKEFDILDNGKRFLIAPEGLSRFYARGFGGQPAASWMTREDREAEIADYINYLEHLYVHLQLGQSQAKIILLGFSQGVATASRWLAASRQRVDAFIICSGQLAPELLEPVRERLLQIPLHYVTGTRDPFLDAVLREQVYALMKNLGASISEFDGVHELRVELLPALLQAGGDKH